MRRILFQETNFNQLPNPPVGYHYVGFNGGIFSHKGHDGQIIESSSGSSGSVVIDVTYSELRLIIATSSLKTGSYYKITDYKTCYDQPDYDYNGASIQTGNYKEGGLSPIIVFAISSDLLASDAYQPEWSNDKIKYDWTFDQTEVTSGTAFGRITYRKDNQGNAFDYDFREVFFKRYDAYFSEEVYNGIISIDSGGNVTGTNSSFENFTVGDIVGILKNESQENDIVNYYEIVSISSDTNMGVTGNTIISTSNARLVDANVLVGMSWKQNNIISNTNDYEYPTFENYESCFNNISINNLTYTQFQEETFLLSNNFFRNTESDPPSTYTYNLFGSGFRNNTFNDDCDSNIIRDDFYNNIFTNDFDHNTINDSFYNNIIDCDFTNNIVNGSFYHNHFGDVGADDFDFNIIDGSFYQNFYTGEDDFEYNSIKGSFYNNIILNGFSKNTLKGFYDNVVEDSFSNNQIGEIFGTNRIYASFNENTIGIDFNDNTIHSDFYENVIGDYFRYNTIGDSGNSSNFDFRQNKIGNDFESNEIRQSFQYNQIGNRFEDNTINGTFYKNFIGNEFYENSTGFDFYGNRIGNNFNGNNAGDLFNSNVIGEYFESNNITYGFENNQIGNQFENNTFGDSQFFDWNDTSYQNLTTRTYEFLFDCLDGNIDDTILNKELIMHDTVNDEYHEVKFTQWTIGNNGGGFSYERTKLFGASGSTGATGVGESVLFTKTNYGSEIDVIVEGSLEITRGNDGAIYNSAEEGSWDGNTPFGTEWNSVYSQSDNGRNFEDNFIGNDFKGNYIKNDFQNNTIGNYTGGNEFLGDFYQNKIGNYTFDNDFNGDVFGNSWGIGFYSNTIGNNFNNNSIGSEFHDNDIGGEFESNHILNVFYDNIIGEGFGYGGNYHQGNRIGNHFYNNTVGEYFYNNTIPDNFENNLVGDYFQMNDIKSVSLTFQNFTQYLGNIVSFTDNTGASPSITGSDGTYNSVGASGGHGLSASFNFEIVGGSFSSLTIATGGYQYLVGDNLTIDSSIFGGSYSLEITVTSTSATPSVYEYYNTTIFKNGGGTNRLSYYDGDDVLVIKDINL